MKVTIIGASASGLFTAYLLAKEGVSVEVFERGDVLSWAPRTLIVTSKINEILDFVPEEAIMNRVRHIELFSRSRSVGLELSSPDLVVERAKLLNLLARLADGAGVKMILKHQFEGFTQFGRKMVVNLRNLETGEEYHSTADVLIGADGAQSAVARATSCNGHQLSALLQARVSLPANARSDTSQIWFEPDRTKYFYWLIPESDQVATVGLIAEDPKRTESELKAFLQQRHLEPFEFQSAPVPMHRFGLMNSALGDNRNVFIVGDAAGQVKGTTVGGLVPGLHGAKALATAILNGGNYRKELRELKFELDLHLLVRRVLNWFDERDYDELIAMLKGGLKNILEESTRDELSETLLSLILKEPRLITLGAKAFFRSILRNSIQPS
ncbi:MAG: FAD-dependent monooxygenase [Thermodesulfobacteriota bacterium]